MSGMRRMGVKVGGVATDAGFSRTAPGGTLNPAFRVPASGGRAALPYNIGPAGAGMGGLAAHPLIDFSHVVTWRLFLGFLAAAYIFGFHVTLGRMTLRLPRI